MMDTPTEHLIHKRVTYTVEVEGQVYIVRNVPARVNSETGERLFAPETIERMHRMIRSTAAPDQVEETPVFDYDSAAA